MGKLGIMTLKKNQMLVQPTLEQGFELQGPHICRLFSINTCTVFNLRLGAAGAEGQLYALIYTILYKGLQHLQILVSAGS